MNWSSPSEKHVHNWGHQISGWSYKIFSFLNISIMYTKVVVKFNFITFTHRKHENWKFLATSGKLVGSEWEPWRLHWCVNVFCKTYFSFRNRIAPCRTYKTPLIILSTCVFNQLFEYLIFLFVDRLLGMEANLPDTKKDLGSFFICKFPCITIL